MSTFDSTEYTFNGYGEFTLLNGRNGTFVLQARMAPISGKLQLHNISILQVHSHLLILEQGQIQDFHGGEWAGHVSYGRGSGITLGFSLRSQAIFSLIFEANKKTGYNKQSIKFKGVWSWICHC